MEVVEVITAGGSDRCGRKWLVNHARWSVNLANWSVKSKSGTEIPKVACNRCEVARKVAHNHARHDAACSCCGLPHE